MGNIRDLLNWSSSYSTINREERNLAAVFYHLLLLGDNLRRFLDLIDSPFQVLESEMGIYLEYAYLRDLWSQIEDNDTKRGLICELLKPLNVDELKKMETVDFNRHFGAVPKPSSTYIQSPGLWSVPRYDKVIEDNDEFLKICMFKWAFNAKPDLVIHTSRDQAVCIEAKFKSGESSYPQQATEKKIFKSRKLRYVKQTRLQEYLMEDLLGIETQLVFLVQKAGQISGTHESLLWKDVFKALDVGGVPGFMEEIIGTIKP